ncbi:MAG: hypothetical protein R2865_00885 [Deinococcales bacterium]
MRRTLRQMSAKETYAVPSTIDDPLILTEIAEVMETRLSLS